MDEQILFENQLARLTPTHVLAFRQNSAKPSAPLYLRDIASFSVDVVVSNQELAFNITQGASYYVVLNYRAKWRPSGKRIYVNFSTMVPLTSIEPQEAGKALLAEAGDANEKARAFLTIISSAIGEFRK